MNKQIPASTISIVSEIFLGTDCKHFENSISKLQNKNICLSGPENKI